MLRNFHSCSPMAHTAPQLAWAHGWRGLLTALVLVAPLLLGGCMIQSKVQGRYVEDQGECRDSAEGNIGRYEKPSMTTKDRNAQLVTLFSNCMAKQGWQVAKPKRTTTTGPHGPLDPYGSSAKTTTTTSAGPVQQPGAAQQPQPITQQQYQQDQQRLISQQQELARQQQQLQATGQQNTQAAADLTRQQQELLRQQLQLQQRMQQQQRAFEGAATQMPVRTTTTPLSPSGSMPPLSQPSSSYYQPARPYTTPQTYGSGAGRNF